MAFLLTLRSDVEKIKGLKVNVLNENLILKYTLHAILIQNQKEIHQPKQFHFALLHFVLRPSNG